MAQMSFRRRITSSTWLFQYFLIGTVPLALFTSIAALPPVVRIGAVFYEGHRKSPSENAFKYAVQSINRDKAILPETLLIYDIQYVPKYNSFHTCKKVCEQVEKGIHAIFGPLDSNLGFHVQSICDALDIPHIEARVDMKSTAKEFSINLHPVLQYVNQAFLDVVRYFNWTRFGVLYEKDCNVLQLKDVMRIPGLEMYVQRVDPHSYRAALNEFKNKKINNIIIDTNSENITLLLKGILQLQMNEYKYHYLFTSFDIESLDLDDFKYNFVNITSFRLIDLEDIGVKEILKNMNAFQQLSYGVESFRNIRPIKSGPALIYDSVYIFAIGLQTLEQSHTLRITNISCKSENPWDGGLSLINYINSVEWKGLTGPIQFKGGRRIQFKLDLVKVKQNSVRKVGEWTPETRLNINDRSIFFDVGDLNATLVVNTILETPYVMMHYGKNYSGNERFFGFCVDILDLVANKVGFDYILDLVPDRKYGAKDPNTGEWNGMVAQLINYNADLAVGSMTINYARESVIDFSKPFMNLGISILFKVPTITSARLFSFMNPLAIEIWLYVLVAYFFVSITTYTVAKFSPHECRNVSPCNSDNHTMNSSFSLGNSFWFAIGTLMQQGSDLNPTAMSTRIVSAVWWFFTLIIISSYTANLAAFLTVERMITPIENADDLASQTEITYGTLDSGSTMTFFRDSMIETYRKMWRFMENKKPSVFTTSYEEGIKRVLEGNYAFLMESSMLDYTVQRNCNLTQIGGLLDTKEPNDRLSFIHHIGYGIAMPMGSPWRDKISLAILELQEKGEIQMLYDKWWKSVGQTCIRNDKKKLSKANALGLDNIGGVFVVLLCGLVIAVCVAIFEFSQYNQNVQTIGKSYNMCVAEELTGDRRIVALDLDSNNSDSSARNGRITFQSFNIVAHERTIQRTFCAEMADELFFALRCMGSRQKPLLKRHCSRCISIQNLRGTTPSTMHRYVASSAIGD